MTESSLAESDEIHRSALPLQRNVAAMSIDVSLIGRTALRVNGQAKLLSSRKLIALLAYLTLRKDLTEARERLARLLWSESEYENGRASLRQTVRDLHEAFEPLATEVVIANKGTVGLVTGRVRTDLDDIFSMAGKGTAHPLLLSIDKPLQTLLEEVEDIDPEFRIWLMTKRRSLSDQLIQLLERTLPVTDRLEDRLVQNATAILALDELHEPAARALMRHYVAIGEETRALRIYSDLWKQLEEQHDSEPSPETQGLAVRIKSGEQSTQLVPVTDADARTEPHEPVGLLIGAMDYSGIAPEFAFRLRAFRQQLLGSLVRFREWFVFDETDHGSGVSSTRLTRQPYRIQIEPFVAPESLGLTLVLKSTANGQCLWSETADLSATTWTDAHMGAIRRLSHVLNVNVSEARLAEVSKEAVAPPGIYDRWLRAHSGMMQFSRSWRDMEAELRDITVKAPLFSLGFRSLAMWGNGLHIACPGVFRSVDRQLDMAAAARRAVELDPVDSRAHLCLAWSQLLLENAVAAKAHAQMGIELNASDSWTLLSGGDILAFCGDIKAAVTYADKAASLVPVQSNAALAYDANIRFAAEDYEGCIRRLEIASDAYPGAQIVQIAALSLIGRVVEARQCLDNALARIQQRWVGDDPPTSSRALEWLSQQFSVLDKGFKERLLRGLNEAYQMQTERV